VQKAILSDWAKAYIPQSFDQEDPNTKEKK
jgi:hypothetical protein